MSFAVVEARFVDAWFRFHPEQATEKGYPRFDTRAPSYGPDDVARFRGEVQRARQHLVGLNVPRGAEESVELELLENQLAMATFPLDELGWLENNPLQYVYAGLAAIEGLELRMDLGKPERDRALLARLKGLRPLMAQLEVQIDEPLEPYHAVAVEMLEEGGDFLAQRFVLDAPLGPLRSAADEARAALDRAHRHLDRCAARLRPFQPMGEERYRRLLRIEHALEESPDDLLALAWRTVAQVDADLPAVRARVDAAQVASVPPGFGWQEVLDYYQHEIERMRQEVIARDLVTIPEGRLELRETPPYLQPLIPGASYVPPPSFAEGGTGYFFVRPVPREMDDEDRLAYHEVVTLRRYRNLVAHECYPGHHVQFLHANRHPSRLRRFRDNDVMVEGWGLYCEQLMQEQGLFDELPSPRPLQALRMRALRVVADVGIHTGRLTLAQAIDEMCRHLGEGSRPWVTREVRRYAAEPTQAMSYLVGREHLLALREEWRDAMGPGRDDLKEFHDRVLREGSIPIPLIRRRLLEMAAPPPAPR